MYPLRAERVELRSRLGYAEQDMRGGVENVRINVIFAPQKIQDICANRLTRDNNCGKIIIGLKNLRAYRSQKRRKAL